MGACHRISINKPLTNLGHLEQYRMGNPVDRGPREIIETPDSWCLGVRGVLLRRDLARNHDLSSRTTHR